MALETAPNTCSSCRAAVAANAKFCSECGAKMPTVKVPDQAERRQLTVMFCDLAGSTALSEGLDPEDLREVLERYQSIASREVRRFGGHIAKYLGDGILVFFGFPEAHEDDAERACLAALGIQQSFVEAQAEIERKFGSRVALRIGIHTGLVVVGEIGGEDYRITDIVGETPNLAARVQDQSPLGGVMVSETTARLAAKAVVLEPVGVRPLKGISRPVELFMVVRARSAAERAGIRETRGRLIGRESELAQMEQGWATAKSGGFAELGLVGEAGMGKSRLMEAALDRAEGELGQGIVLQCAVFRQETPLFPVAEALGEIAGISLEDERHVAEAKLADYAEARQIQSALPLLLRLLGLAETVSVATNAGRDREETLQFLVEYVARLAKEQPLVLVIENAHWADPSTLELLERCRKAAPNGVFLVVTTRPPEPAAIAAMPLIRLDRLTEAESEEVLRQASDDADLPEEVRGPLIERGEGIPLFLQELARSVIESGELKREGEAWIRTAPEVALSIPMSLRDSLTARLDRLGLAKETAQMASVVGREFSLTELSWLADQDARSLNRALQPALDSGLIEQEGSERFRFHHALVQEAAYGGILRVRRQMYHQAYAQGLEDMQPERARQSPELLARHWGAAGRPDRELPYWLEAGAQARAKSAHIESIALYERALELVRQMPPSPEAIGAELACQAGLGFAHSTTKGFSASPVGPAFTRARELCDMLGDIPETAPVLGGLTAYYQGRGEFDRAEEASDTLGRIAEKTGDAGLALERDLTVGALQYFQARFADSLETLGRVERGYDPGAHAGHAILFGQDPRVAALSYAGCGHWQLGRFATAYATLDRALDYARQLDHSFSVAWALGVKGYIVHMARDTAAALASADELIQFGTVNVHPYWQLVGVLKKAYALFYTGEQEAGLAMYRHGAAVWEASGSVLQNPHIRGCLAVLELDSGNIDRAGELLDSAEQQAVETRQIETVTELWRIRYRLLRARGAADAAEQYAAEGMQRCRELDAVGRALQWGIELVESGSPLGPTELRYWRGRVQDGFDFPDVQRADALLAGATQ